MEKDELNKINDAKTRLKKLGEIYYSHSKESQKLINQYIDKVHEMLIQQHETVTSSEIIEELAEKFSNVHIARLGVSPDREERKKFFIDVMFEKYNTDELKRSLKI